MRTEFRSGWIGWCAGVLALAIAPGAGAQPIEGLNLDELPEQVRLGVRVEMHRRSVGVIDALVIVPDGISYLHAIGAWTPERRFPVLIDDGSAQAAEDIARFSRGFKPSEVIRWSHPDAMPGDGAERRRLIEKTKRRIWGLPEDEPAANSWKTDPRLAPGVVVMNEDDPAWTAGFALAVGRAQPIVWSERLGQIGEEMALRDAERFARFVEEACEATGLSWRETGDKLGGVTIAMRAPVRLNNGERIVALTDFVGRHGDDPRGEQRWGWAGHIFGNEARAAYMAMSALFYRPEQAWLFNGYQTTGSPWTDYNLAPAREQLEGMGLRVADQGRAGSHRAWQLASQRVLRAGLVMVNSRGMRDHFDLNPGTARPGDIPVLDVPTAVYFIHSWSAVHPGTRGTVAGRWLERGAFCYFGSTDEPYLQSFLPGPAVAQRMRVLVPWGAATRIDRAPIWKLAVIGDPLWVVGQKQQRVRGDVPLKDAVELRAEMASAAREGRLEEAVRLLSVMGRDGDAASLVASALRDNPEKVTPGLAHAALMPVFRAGRGQDFIELYRKLGPDEANDPARRDALWHVARPMLEGSEPERVINLLLDHVRDDETGSDAAAIARAMGRAGGTGAAIAYLDRIEPRNDRDRRAMEAARQRLRGQP
ncbi:MAG: hypothetical protein JJU33_00490 [Phycisphaerales bacterium]|nr:hypothetical protein [Phycisphaerales bacterium]